MKRDGSMRGFTLIELLVVISIIGLLSSIVLASLNSARVKARNVSRNASAIEIRTAFNLAYNGTYPNVSYAYPCVTATCYGGWAQFVAESTTDAYLSPYIKKPTDPADSTRGIGGFLLLTPSNWPGSHTSNSVVFPQGYYLDYLLEPGGECPGGAYWNTTSAYVQCVLRLD